MYQLVEALNDNVVIICQNGRSRSPTYLMAYLIVCMDLNLADARRAVTEKFQAARHIFCEPDRDHRFDIILNGLTIY